MLKVVLKTALKTLIIIIVALLFAFGIVSLATPGMMAYAFEQCGAYTVAAGYASIQYKYTGDVGDLARCFQDCVYAGDDKSAASFGGQLIIDPRFSDYCEKTNAELSENLPEGYDKSVDYMQFVYGKTACAKYSTGDGEGALALIDEGLRHTTGFPENNALVDTAIRAAEKNDGAMKADLKEILDKITPAESESGYYNRVKNILEENRL